MRALSTIFKVMLFAFLLLSCFANFATADGPTPPADMFLKAEPTDTTFELRVTWKDFRDEEYYELLSTSAISPGPIFEITNDGGWKYGLGWTFVTALGANTTEFTDTGVLFTTSYALCGRIDLSVTCIGPSNYAEPKFPPPAPASVDSLHIYSRSVGQIGVNWTQSANTVYSRASISQGAGLNESQSVENDSNQSVLFTGLDPNTEYTIRICVRNNSQTATDETCRTLSEKTLPLIPLAARSIEVDLADPDPHKRKVTVRYNNTQSNAVAGLRLALIKGEQIVQYTTFYPTTFDERDYIHTFTNLTPFTAYQASAVPYNESGAGTAATISITTPTEVKIYAVKPLSGDSVMISFSALTIGRYEIQRQTGALWKTIGSIQINNPAIRIIVVENINGPEKLRMSWKLAYLTTQSAPVTARPLAKGTPELVALNSRQEYVASPPRIITRDTATFRPTIQGRAEYTLLRQTGSTNWTGVASTGMLPTTQKIFSTSILYSLSVTSNISAAAYKVCQRRLTFSGPPELCGASSAFVTNGLPRFGISRFSAN
jgi:hypothetical protein